MVKLIVNADDYGFDENRNKAISECMRLGWVSNTTLMVNMSGCDEAVSIAKRNGFAEKVGLHLNLMEGCPLTEEIRTMPRFCDADGRFNGVFVKKTRFFEKLTQAEESAVRKEVVAQFQKYVDLGLPTRHFDSHCYSHTKWGIVPVAFSVARQFDFKTARRPGTLGAYRVGVKKIFPNLVYWRIKKYGLKHTDNFTAPAYIFNHWDKVHDEMMLEIMVHPMYLKDGCLDMAGEMSDSGLRPMKEVPGFFNSLGAEVCSFQFSDIAADRV